MTASGSELRRRTGRARRGATSGGRSGPRGRGPRHAPRAVAAAPPAPAPGLKRWYIVHTYSGFEAKVKESLQQRVDAMGMGDWIDEVLIPTEEVVEVREGKKTRSTRKFFPGYVLVKMAMSDAAWHVVKSTPQGHRLRRYGEQAGAAERSGSAADRQPDLGRGREAEAEARIPASARRCGSSTARSATSPVRSKRSTRIDRR